MDDVSRRRFLALVPAAALIPTVRSTPEGTLIQVQQPSAPPGFPRHDPALARETVGASHANLARVKELVSASPALARAAWDWGYGDWETALAAASHVGNKEIAAVLLAAGAHPTIFSAAMLGQLETVKAFIAASPGIQKTRGPHGLPLLDHAKAGRARPWSGISKRWVTPSPGIPMSRSARRTRQDSSVPTPSAPDPWTAWWSAGIPGGGS